jgi:hypothetical protein
LPQHFLLLSNYGWLPQHPSCKEYCTLWCLFLADKEPFKVDLPLNLDFDVDDLKGLIHIKATDTTKSTLQRILFCGGWVCCLNNSDYHSLFQHSQGNRNHWNQMIHFPIYIVSIVEAQLFQLGNPWRVWLVLFTAG